MKIKTKTDFDQAILDAERIKAIVDSGELATDTEVVLVDGEEPLEQEAEAVDKSSEQVVNDYLGELELNHNELPDAQQPEPVESNFTDAPADGEIDLQARASDSLNIQDVPQPPSQTTTRPFLKAPTANPTVPQANTLPPNTYYGADPSVSLMG